MPLLPSTASKYFPPNYQTIIRHAANLQNPFKWIYNKNFISNSGSISKKQISFILPRKKKKVILGDKRKKKRSAAKNVFPLFFFSPVLGNGGPNEKGADQGGMNYR